MMTNDTVVMANGGDGFYFVNNKIVNFAVLYAVSCNEKYIALY